MPYNLYEPFPCPHFFIFFYFYKSNDFPFSFFYSSVDNVGCVFLLSKWIFHLKQDMESDFYLDYTFIFNFFLNTKSLYFFRKR